MLAILHLKKFWISPAIDKNRLLSRYGSPATKRVVHRPGLSSKRRKAVSQGCLIRYQRLNSPVIPRQLPCVPEKGSNQIYLRIALALKFGHAKIVQNRLVYRWPRDAHNEHLCENCKTQGINNRSEIWVRGWDGRENCYNSVVDTF